MSVERYAQGECPGASAPGHGAEPRVWGSKGKGKALPLASDREADKRSGVGRMVCLPSLDPTHSSAATCEVSP